MMSIKNIAKILLIGVVIFLVCFIIYVIVTSINTIPNVLETHSPTANEVESIKDYIQ